MLFLLFLQNVLFIRLSMRRKCENERKKEFPLSLYTLFEFIRFLNLY